MIFNKVSIGEVVTLRQGFAINKNTKHHMSDEPTDLHLLRIGDMKDGSYSIYVKDTIPAHFIANEDDIIYTRTGQVGLVFRKQHGVIHNNCFSVTPQNEDVLDRGFLFYVLQTKEFYEEANSKASGAAQPDLPHGAFNSISIPIPDIDIQRKISNILKSYDDLIENNQKQIKLLEEAAQRLYKEWFVDLRFPGYEKTEIIDGVPVGWKKEKLVKIADIKAGGDKPEEYSNNKTRENSIPIYANGTEKEGLFGYTNKPVITDESVTISARGTVGCVFLRRTPYVPIVRLLSVIPYEVSAVYLYYCLSNEQFERNGTSQQQITVPMVKDKLILIADKETVRLFVQKVIGNINKKDVLTEQCKLLKEARDRLLPKLMNGEIEI